jgi:hypothetical protein
MKVSIINLLLLGGLIIQPLIVYAEEQVPNEVLQEARLLAKSFGNDLKHALKTSMKSGGPLKAIEICNLDAGPIAEKNALLSDWIIGRTSLKPRNESNAPDTWESKVLEQFEKRKASGENVKDIEYFESFKEDGQLVYRYMKPIPTSGLCLACHGVTVSDEITKKINSLYPNDTATGFSLGDIRGAFTLKKIKIETVD